MEGYCLKEGVIVVDRDLSELDEFLRDFLQILNNHSNHLVVSGFVSISTGRTRATEHIDVLTNFMTTDKFRILFEELSKRFWCYQRDTSEEAYAYFENYNSIRFAKHNTVFPNIELIPVDQIRKAKFYELNNPQKLKIKNLEFSIPPIEFEILYKEIILGSKKDMEDAKHLRIFFEDFIDSEKFKLYEPIVKAELK